MSDDLEKLVRESLRSVDRSRRVSQAATGLLVIVVVFTLAFLFAHAGATGTVSPKMLFVAVAFQMAFIGLCVALLAGHVTRMTKAVLRAIELSRK